MSEMRAMRPMGRPDSEFNGPPSGFIGPIAPIARITLMPFSRWRPLNFPIATWISRLRLFCARLHSRQKPSPRRFREETRRGLIVSADGGELISAFWPTVAGASVRGRPAGSSSRPPEPACTCPGRCRPGRDSRRRGPPPAPACSRHRFPS